MYLLGIAGLADVEPFLLQHYPEQMAGTSRIIQGMDAAAALLCDGQVIAAVSEERFDRVKKSGAFPYQSIDYCLRTAGITMAQVDHVAGNFEFQRYAWAYQTDDARRYWQQCLSSEAIASKLDRRYGTSISFHPIDHHHAHLHAALASAPFEQCLAIVMDAAGEIGSTSVYDVSGTKAIRLRRYPISRSLGMFYSLITQYLGFVFNEDEYKIMGLAALGNADRYAEFFKSAILLTDDGGIEIPCLAVNHNFADGLFFQNSSKAIAEGLGFDGVDCSFEQRADVSAGLQKRFTEALFHICHQFRDVNRNLLLSGGCAENCSAVGDLRTSGLFDHIHVSYASGDEGTALGAVAALSYTIGQPLRIPSQMPFFGPAPKLNVVRDLAEKYGVIVDEFGDERMMLESAADDVAQNRIVALCHGRMEYGARALGNRSLLALPADPNNKERINLAIKKRQNYRPFAPAVIAEVAHEYFDLRPGEAYPYMTMLTTVRETAVPKLPAIVHIDGTARVQTVDRQHNPAFYHFLAHLGVLTGMPVVLNTSYNVNHQPIVCSEQEALETFLEMEIDALYIAQARVTRRTK